MRRTGNVLIVLAVVTAIVVGVTAVAQSPNLPPGCEPCRPEFSPSEPVICPLSDSGPFQAYNAGGRWLGQWASRCAACTFPNGSYCSVEGPPPQ